MTRKRVLLILGLGILVLLLACGPAAPTTIPTATKPPPTAPNATPAATKPPPTAPNATPAATKPPPTAPATRGIPKAGGILRMVLYSEPVGWNVPWHTASNVHDTGSAVWQRLVTVPYGAEYKPMDLQPTQPELAESWDIPNDTTFIFKLRQGVKWQNKPPVSGREFTADDVVWNYQRFQVSPVSSLFEVFDKVEALDKYTVKFTTKAPYAPALMGFARNEAMLIPKEAVDPAGDLKGVVKPDRVIGTGPFRFKEYFPGVRWVVERNPDYWKPGLPYVDRVEMLVIPEKAVQISAFRTKNVDFAWFYAADAFKDIRRTYPEAYVHTEPAWFGAVLSVRADVGPFTDVRVRRAVSLAIDRENWLKKVYGESYAVMPTGDVVPALAKDWVPPVSEWPQDARHWLIDYNPEEAKALLKEAGYEKGFKMKLITTGPHDPNRESELVAAFLSKIGIQAEIVSMDYTAFQGSITRGTYPDDVNPTAVSSYAVKGIEVDDVFSNIYLPKGRNSRTHAYLVDPKIVELTQKQRSTVDTAKRKEVIQELVFYSARQAYNIYYPLSVMGFVAQPWLKDMWFKGLIINSGKAAEFAWLDR